MSRTSIRAAVAVFVLFITAIQARAEWGAAVYCRISGTHGWSIRNPSKEVALSRAISNAGNPRDPITVFVENGYGVIIVDRTGGYAVGTGRTYQQALRSARLYCPGGVVRAWVGSYQRTR